MNQTTLPPERTVLGRSTLLHLPDGLSLQLLALTDTYWHHKAAHVELTEGRVLSVFDYTSTWTWWERHPDGDEFVHIIAGDVDFVLDHGHSEHRIHLSSGDGTIIPQGAWHRAVLRAPSQLLFVTPTPARTEHRDVS